MPHVSAERRDLAMTVGDLGRRASAQNLISQCARFLLTPEEAASLIDDMEGTVRARWYEVARREGVSERDCETMRSFVYEGFRLEA